MVASLIGRRGFLIRDRVLLGRLAGTLVSNGYGSRALGEMIEPWIQEIVGAPWLRPPGGTASPGDPQRQGLLRIWQEHDPALQRALVEALGLDWLDFALITPDIWRKYLLDYDSLGPARRYAGPLTGHELRSSTASSTATWRARRLADASPTSSSTASASTASRSIPHEGSKLLTRFGRSGLHVLHDHAAGCPVERAWKRGEQFGRYKAVDLARDRGLGVHGLSSPDR